MNVSDSPVAMSPPYPPPSRLVLPGILVKIFVFNSALDQMLSHEWGSLRFPRCTLDVLQPAGWGQMSLARSRCAAQSSRLCMGLCRSIPWEQPDHLWGPVILPVGCRVSDGRGPLCCGLSSSSGKSGPSPVTTSGSRNGASCPLSLSLFPLQCPGAGRG